MPSTDKTLPHSFEFTSAYQDKFGLILACLRPSKGDPREEKADAFDFPFPSRNVEKVIKRKKKSKVWLKVWKVISKMLEENEKFRHRLLTFSQFNGEGNDVNQSSQKKALPMDREKCSKKIKEDSDQKEI
ncbi:uncharacterized protein C5orf47 homolog [Excalfactoria chinensis]|uniref:uncharacterized protein C5orf47 homolog n=1 Tax=Excalfactoria chinensis TaxID=46218 RepID=UPI003B3BA2A9